MLERDDWQGHRDWKRLTPEDQERLAADVREVLFRLARARVHLARRGADSATARVTAAGAECLNEALRLVERAEHIRGLRPSPALWEDRAQYLKQLGDGAASAAASAKAKRLPPV